MLQDLQEEKGFSYLFVAHDLAVVRHIADRVMVMYLGRVVEIGPKAQIYTAPQHPYTQALLSAAPEPDPDRKVARIILKGDIPSPIRVPAGCSFHTRCPIMDVCRVDRPVLREVAHGQFAACHFATPSRSARLDLRRALSRAAGKPASDPWRTFVCAAAYRRAAATSAGRSRRAGWRDRGQGPARW